MADSYSKWVMTTAFANNSQAALNSGGKIEWVSLKTSDDAHQVADLDGFNDTTLATANIKQISGISSVTISGNTVTITGLFNSTNNASDYYIRTIFLVAKYNGKEFLAGTTVANTSGSAFRMPASSDTEITEFTARPQISVTNTNSISTTVDPVASATNERVDSLEATLQGEIDDINVDKQNLWNKLADYVTKAAAETITGVKTFSQTIVGSITGNAGTATKLQTERTIGFSGDVNGTAQGFDGSKNITLPINLNSINQNNTTSTQSAGYNSPVTIIDGITRDTKGRVTGVNTKTVTLPPVQTTISGNAASATKLEIARLIGGVSFDGTSDIILPGVNSIGNQNTTGNAATATNANLATKAVALQTPRKINGTDFDGTSDINVLASNDGDIVHKSGNEIVNGNKTFKDWSTFSKPIQGGLGVRTYPFTTIAELSGKLVEYSGKWGVTSDKMSDLPQGGYAILTVYPYIDNGSSGFATLQYTSGDFYFSDINGANVIWKKVAKDNEAMHLYGDETVAGFKKFSGNIATTSDNSMINGGGNNGDLAMVKKERNSSYLAVGNSNPNFTVKQSNNDAISPSDMFQDMFTVNVDGTVKAGLQQDLVPLDKNVAHNSGNEMWSGSKTFSDETIFNAQINGSLKTRYVPVFDFNTLASDTKKYSGLWFVSDQNVVNGPTGDVTWGTIEVIAGNTYTTGLIRYTRFFTGETYITSVNGGIVGWYKVAKDANVVHNTGKEDIFGMKSLRNGAAIYQGLELFDQAPYIDFHFNNDTADFTSRIIESDKGNLLINGVNVSGGTVSGALNGNASSATKLQTTRNINGVGFDGTSDITVDPVTHVITSPVDIFTFPNGFYYNSGADSTNKPSSSRYLTFEIFQTSSNGFIRAVDHEGNSFWATKSGNNWGVWRQDADNSTVVHKDNDETLAGNKNFSGVATFAKAQTSSTIKKTITTNAPITLNFAETAFGVMVYASASGTFTADSAWKTLATLPTEISAPVQIVTLNDVGWAGVGGVTNRFGVGLKIAIKPNREITYRVTSLKENDNTTYNVGTDFDLSTYWSK